MAESLALNMDCMAYMRTLPDASFDVVVADPPYNIGKAEWDRWPSREAYRRDALSWLREFSRIVKPTGSVWMFHSDMSQLVPLMAESMELPGLAFSDFVVLHKRNFRAKAWKTAECARNTGLRSLFVTCEYLVHWFATPGTKTEWDKTGLERIYSTPECFAPLKDWYRQRRDALGLTEKDILLAYQRATGKDGGMLRHYFKDSQFAIPTGAVWKAVYEPLGFGPYEELRNFWSPDDEHCNVWEFRGGAGRGGWLLPSNKQAGISVWPDFQGVVPARWPRF